MEKENTNIEVLLADYEIVNLEKWDRVINGTLGKEGRLFGGVGEDAPDMLKLVQYDKLGGLIKKGGRVVKNGAFYDFKMRQARKKPVIEFLFRDIEGNEVVIPENEEIPMEVRAAEMIRAKNGQVGRPKKANMKKEEKMHGGKEIIETGEMGIDEEPVDDDA